MVSKMKNKKQYMYIHTIEGKPASFFEFDRQICYVDNNSSAKLVSLKQIKKEQKITIKNRKKWSEEGHICLDEDNKYGYIKIEIPFKICGCDIKKEKK